jgi:spore coat protein U-like protein
MTEFVYKIVWALASKLASERDTTISGCRIPDEMTMPYSESATLKSTRENDMKRRNLALLALGMMPWIGLHAQQTAQATFRVSARVDAVCEVTAADLEFGVYVAQSDAPLAGTTLLRATCTPDTTYYIGLDQGQSPGATVNQRKMVSGAEVLNYQLYSDASHSVIWGNTTGTDTVTGVGTGLAQDITVFGSIPASQVIPAGDYTDTITVRVYY